MSSTDRVVLITGVTGVLGREVARVFAENGARLGLVGNLVIVKTIDEKGERTTDRKKASWTGPDEIAATLRFLASDDAAAVNGARVPLYGRG